MGQLSLYVEDATIEKLNFIAKANNLSTSKYVASIINERLFQEDAEEFAKKKLLRELCGAIQDETVVVPEEIPWDVDPDGGSCSL